MGTAYSSWSARAWKPKNASATRQYRARVDSYMNYYPTYCTITSTLYLELDRSVSHNNYHWWAVNGGSGTVSSVFEGAKLIGCYSWTSGAYTRGHTASTTYTQGAISASSSSGSNTWNGEWVYATEYYTVPARDSWTITYNANDGSGRTTTQTKWYDEDLTLLGNNYWTREGYGFLKWNTQADGTGTDYTAGSSYNTNGTPGTLYAIWQAPPTCDVIEPSSSIIYYTSESGNQQNTKYTVNISNINVDTSAVSTATVNSIVLQIGTDTASTNVAGNQSLTVEPTAAGNFTPTVKITDTLGSSTTYSLTEIEVKQYFSPVLVMEVGRTTLTGVFDDTEGHNCVITANLLFCSDVYNLIEPTISCVNNTDSSSVDLSNKVTWYTTRNSGSGTVSGAISWPLSIQNNSITIYGLVTGNLLDPLNSYTFSITPRDNRSSGIIKTGSLPVAFYTMDFLAGGRGVSIGKVAEEENFDSAMEAWFRDVIYLVVDGNASTLSEDSDILLDAYIAHGLNSAYWGITEHGWLSGGGEE